jgi:hypothetical protein
MDTQIRRDEGLGTGISLPTRFVVELRRRDSFIRWAGYHGTGL